MSGDRRRPLGAAGEKAVAAYLRSRGYAILDVNWRCRIGEIDVVAAKDGILAFVEVRSRSRKSLGSFGTPLESITPKKQLTLRRCAEAYLQRSPSSPSRIRFDCAGVVFGDDGTHAAVDYVEDAF